MLSEILKYVAVCPICEGEGEFDQPLTAGGIAECDYCEGMEYVYKHTKAPISISVKCQIDIAQEEAAGYSC